MLMDAQAAFEMIDDMENDGIQIESDFSSDDLESLDSGGLPSAEEEEATDDNLFGGELEILPVTAQVT